MHAGNGISLSAKAAELEGQANQLEITIANQTTDGAKQAIRAQVKQLREESATWRSKADAERAQKIAEEDAAPPP
jgi:uncharacterized NAD(P)/FAD-binding protein YdhS